MRIRKLLQRVLLAAACAALLAAAAIALSPKPSLYGNYSFSTLIEDRNGELLQLTLAADERYRLRTALSEMHPSFIDATLLYEDRYFYSHPGVNPAALLRAGWASYIQKNRLMGASTITMQLARMRYQLNTRSLRGKLLQIARALQIERHYSKDDILEAYLNLAPYGGNIEGAGTAALIYFNKAASQLSLPEALALAVIPQNPVQRNPIRQENRQQWFAARQRLLEQWVATVDTSPEVVQQFDLALAVRSASELPFRAPHFVRNFDKTGGRTTSSLDLRMQDLLERQLRDYVARRQTLGIHNASAMLVDTRTMQVLASVGSAGFFNSGIAGQVDGTRAKRSPGSTLKPFVYGMAIDDGLIHPMSMLKDAPKRFAAYAPENFDRGFMGPVAARDALIYSRNVPAIELLSRIGHDRFHRFLQNGDIHNLEEADYYGLAMVLGGIELSMEETVRLYAMLANGGRLRPLSRRRDEPARPGQRLLSPEASFLVLDMLRHNPRPGGSPHDPIKHNIAWKTGTSYAFRDAWSVGVLGPYVLAVWVGNFDGSSNPAFVGRQAAAPLFFTIADALANHLGQAFPAPAATPDLNLRTVDICASTGDLPGKYCPHTEAAWFVPGVSPIRVSTVHRAIAIDNASGLRSCNPDPATFVNKIYEFWPSDISAVLQRAGISVRQPPAWMPGCDLATQAAQGQAPQIVSVSENVDYPLRPSHSGQLALSAVTDADAHYLYWFTGNEFIGKAAADEVLLWQPYAGTHDLLTVDDLGRSDQIRVQVASVQ